MNAIDALFDVLRRVGTSHYGETDVTQYEHALQCAVLAERDAAPPALIAAALLHDIGHLSNPDDLAASRRGVDAGHEDIGAELLSQWFGEAVSEPVRLHVPAKRYLTAVEDGYFGGLSRSSVRSLALQGGPFTAAAARYFIALPHAEQAVRLRRWDEAAKMPGIPTPDLERYRPCLSLCIKVAP